MKEILYIQAGSLSNYTGTHFWNTQESYFTYEDSQDPLTTHDISFREGLTQTGEPTYCPRLLIFDRKANFGGLASDRALGTEDDEAMPSLWNGNVAEYRQDPITQSSYHTHMEESDGQEPSEKTNNSSVDQATQDIRYWSDFSHVSYIPRTIQKIPDAGEWETTDGDWTLGQETFSRFDEDSALMEDALRLFLEECDSLQGIQITNDTKSFGSFIHSFLISFRDEFVKLPCLVFPILSEAISRQVEVDDYRGTRKVINDALYLRGMNDLSSMSIPIQSPSTWAPDAWGQVPRPDSNRVYHDSAILATHIESSTLPLRLNDTHEDLSSFSSQLNWRGVTPFGQLSGISSVTTSADLDTRIINFSSSRMVKDATHFTRRDVTRGFSPSLISAYDNWSARQSLQDSLVSKVHAPAYLLPKSYFPSTGARRSGILTPLPSASVFSSISTASTTADFFSRYITFIEGCIKRKPAVESIGIDTDELKELASDLWTLHDNFDDGEGRDGDDDVALGEDEA